MMNLVTENIQEQFNGKSINTSKQENYLIIDFIL